MLLSEGRRNGEDRNLLPFLPYDVAALPCKVKGGHSACPLPRWVSCVPKCDHFLFKNLITLFILFKFVIHAGVNEVHIFRIVECVTVHVHPRRDRGAWVSGWVMRDHLNARYQSSKIPNWLNLRAVYVASRIPDLNLSTTSSCLSDAGKWNVRLRTHRIVHTLGLKTSLIFLW